MVRTTATVLRRGPGNIGAVQEEIPIEELVPGDVVFLAAGDLVPADVRLLASRDLFISQSILSGESLPVENTMLWLMWQVKTASNCLIKIKAC